MSNFEPGGEQASIVSVTDRVCPAALGASVSSAYFLGDRAAFVGAEENVSLVDARGEISKVAVLGRRHSVFGFRRQAHCHGRR